MPPRSMNPLRHSENSPFSLLNPPEGSAAATEGSLDTLVSQEEVHLGWGALWRGLICTHAHTHAHAHAHARIHGGGGGLEHQPLHPLPTGA